MALLVERFGLPLFKIPSGEIINGPLLLHIARTGWPVVIIPTGISTLREVETALGVLTYGYLHFQEKPGLDAFRAAYISLRGQEVLREKVTLLHCTTEYPAPFEEVNLCAMDLLRAAFGLPVDYSDHTQGIAVPIAAVARVVVVIEKHFTPDRTLPGANHRASLEPDELKQMVQAIRRVEQTLGNGIKAPTPSEIKNILVARRILVASRAINKGEQFTSANLAIKRPGTGTSPMLYWDYLRKRAVKNYLPDEQI